MRGRGGLGVGLGFGLLSALLAACKPSAPAPVDAGVVAEAPVDAAAPAPLVDGKKLATNHCMSCHSEEMLAQQRLTHPQWAAVVKKMSGWGSTVEPHEVGALADWLAATYGPDAGPWTPRTIGADAAAAELAELPDGPFANGDVEHGRALFSACSSCHAPNARGAIGVNLVDRPVLRRAADVAEIVRKGRGKMLPVPGTSDRDVADLVAYLRTLG